MRNHSVLIVTIIMYLLNGCSKKQTSADSAVNLESITIGSKVWSIKNLDVTTYRNGDVIPYVTDHTVWEQLTTGAWCYYNNDPANGAVYGKLYNWYAVNDPRGLAPKGWRIPTLTDWDVMIKSLGDPSQVAGMLKSTTLWKTPNVDATNSSGFSALPGGSRRSSLAPFYDITEQGNWWTASSLYGAAAYINMHYDEKKIDYDATSGAKGMSVRCIKL
jgi:uncharacterized protein (TIGR02145 family)